MIVVIVVVVFVAVVVVFVVVVVVVVAAIAALSRFLSSSFLLCICWCDVEVYTFDFYLLALSLFSPVPPLLTVHNNITAHTRSLHLLLSCCLSRRNGKAQPLARIKVGVRRLLLLLAFCSLLMPTTAEGLYNNAIIDNRCHNTHKRTHNIARALSHTQCDTIHRGTPLTRNT